MTTLTHKQPYTVNFARHYIPDLSERARSLRVTPKEVGLNCLNAALTGQRWPHKILMTLKLFCPMLKH